MQYWTGNSVMLLSVTFKCNFWALQKFNAPCKYRIRSLEPPIYNITDRRYSNSLIMSPSYYSNTLAYDTYAIIKTNYCQWIQKQWVHRNDIKYRKLQKEMHRVYWHTPFNERHCGYWALEQTYLG